MEFDSESAYGFLEKLVKEIGNRESATDSEKRAAHKIKIWFEKLGLKNARLEEFEVRTSRFLKEEAYLPDGTDMKCSAVGNSSSTPPEGVEGNVIFLESVAMNSLKVAEGKIAVVGPVLYRKDFERLVKAQPLALILPSRAPLAPATYRSIRAEYTENYNVPVVSMAHDDVLRVLKGPRRLKIVTKLENVTAKSQNVFAELPGEISDEDILVGGHYDTVRSVTGAHDNASGIAMVLELARVFSGQTPKRTLRFAAFGSEELGLRGSMAYAEIPENSRNLRFYYNFDVHGILLGSLSVMVLGPDELKSLMRVTAKELGIPMQISSQLETGGSDHMTLALYGVPSVMLSRGGGAASLMHTDLEDLRWCGSSAFVNAGRLGQTVLHRLVEAEEFPFEKEIPLDIQKPLEKRFEDLGIKKKN